MAWIMESDGWRDETSEGPYTDCLKTKGDFKICRLTSPHRDDNLYVLSKARIEVQKFKTIAEAKLFAEGLK